MRDNTIYCINYWLKKGFTYNESIANVERLKKETSWRCKEFWIKRGYSEQDAILEISKKQRDLSLRYDKSKKKNNPYSEEYYIKKGITDIDEIRKQIQELKDRSNPYLILSDEKISEILDKRKKTYYSRKQEEINKINKKRGRTKEQLIRKFGKDYVEKLLQKRGNSNRNRFGRSISKISKELFDILSKMNKNKIFLYGKNEKFILNKNNKNKGYFIDFLYEKESKIIEFNGDFWHFNPIKYLPESFTILNNKRINAIDIWKEDEEKIEYLKKLGYDVLIVWENEYKKNKLHVIEICDNFINDKKI